MQGIQNIQKYWQKCGVVEAAHSNLNLCICLNPDVTDGKHPVLGFETQDINKYKSESHPNFKRVQRSPNAF